MKLYEKCINRNYIFRGKIVSLRKDTVELANGEEAFREVVEHNGGVCVLAIDENDNVLLVEQFRYPFEKVLLEIPAGRLEKNEDVRECGLRELREETGYVAKSFEPLCEIYPSVGFSNEKIFVFVAKNLKFEATNFDEDEFLNLRQIPYETVLKMVLSGEIKDGKTIAAILLYNEKFKNMSTKKYGGF